MKPGKPLSRRTGLTSSSQLSRSTPLTAHTDLSRSPSLPRAPFRAGRGGGETPQQARGSEVDRDVRANVYERDGHACVRCGKAVGPGNRQLQHRVARGMGGRADHDRPSALILLCGVIESAHAGGEHGHGHFLEPDPSGTCTKVRLSTRDEAAAYARAVEADLCREEGALEPYTCRVCPRHPVTSNRYWHVANREPGKRTGHAGAEVQREEERRARGRQRVKAGRSTLAERLGADAAGELRRRTQ